MRKWRYAAGAFIVVLAAALLIYELSRGGREPLNRTAATWVWDLDELLGAGGSRTGEVMDFLRERRVNAVYLYMGKSAAGPGQSLYRAFIQAASDAGVEVHALGGERNWALSEGWAGLRDYLEQVASYNESAPEGARFKGIHLDVEPYLLPEWAHDQSGLTREWEQMVDQAAAFAASHSLELGVDLPFWLDDIPASASSLDGKPSATLDQWMMDRVDSVALMSYRNEAEGTNGVIALVQQELQHAEASGCRVFVGLNAAPDEEAALTFYGTSPERLRRAAELIQREFAGNAGFAGIAVHDLAAWMRLEQQG
ncbi:hypothetical protein COLU111180_20870 [Cohnella lubricantis]|uniref:Uncharacterized protein n=1 Tax=Cohnella lubricantis TaxID=2163172 RepID=A0A841T4P8_9BACL|nr:hypothetical protein [Cohnella lubricantis]MBB6675812.1 hypothetical protein [Cohnella lubricantis]MBP2120655.1 hypothetical protein [Cohnella lubricantis]